MSLSLAPSGPFDLLHQNEFFGSWPALTGDPAALVITFPVEGWRESAAVVVRQEANGSISGVVHGAKRDGERAWEQALATLSLDVDGSHWSVVGRKDPVIGNLQERYRYLRPLLFHSPYEAAAAFVIGHRISIAQTRNLRKKLSEAHGDRVMVEGQAYHAFPLPRKILELDAFPAISTTKIERLKGVAQAALNGLLDRQNLRAKPPQAALADLETIPGIGPFFSQGILYRGAGLTDSVPDDDLTRKAIQIAYKMDHDVTREEMLQTSANWKPYAMWCTVLLHIWLRSEVGLPKKRTFSR